MSIASELSHLTLNKSTIKAAIAAKCPDIPPTDSLSQWPKSVMSIKNNPTFADSIGLPKANWKDDGETWLFVDLSRSLVGSNRRTASFGATGRFNIDWGDGTSEDVDISGFYPVNISHEYSENSGDNFEICLKTSTVSNGSIRFGYNSSYCFGYLESGVVYAIEFGANTNLQTGMGGSGYNAGRSDGIVGYLPIRVHFGAGRVSCGVDGPDLMINSCVDISIGDNVRFDYPYTSQSHFSPRFAGAFPSIDMTKVIPPDGIRWESFSYMFKFCRGLSSIDVSHLDTSNAVSMYRMFNTCESLTYLDLSGFDTSNVTTFFQMFASCRSLVSVDVSSFNTSNVTEFSGMFIDCLSLYSIDISNFDFSSATDIQRMFWNCQSLKKIVWPEIVDTSNVSLMNGMFYNTRIEGVYDVSNWDMSKVTNALQMFQACDNMTAVVLPSTLNKVYSNMFTNSSSCMLFDFRNSTEVIPLDNVNAFQGINADSKIVVPDSLYSAWIETTNWSNSSIQPKIISASGYEALQTT